MKRALVVDDEPLLRRQVAEIVSGYGFDEILEAENGVQAVEIAIHQDRSQILSCIRNKIHRKKSEVANNVDIAQRGVKFYAVKCHNAGRQADQVLEV